MGISPMSGTGSLPLKREAIQDVMQAVVQIVALKRGMMGNMQSVWTGSGTIVDPEGVILTNCHVANPRAMGMPAPDPDLLAVSITQRSDEPPALTYIAEVVVYSPQLDLAVLRVKGGLDGKPVRNLRLPFVPVGNSDTLDLGDVLTIFGYPGIGGETVTLTSGMVSGFTSEKGVEGHRAWIKSDATIAGGNSGGTAVNAQGELVGVPTQAAAGSGVTPVDARPVVDTNRDGRVDQRDTPMAIGGFINGLRPVNLAKPLLAKAGISTTSARPSSSARPSTGKTTATAPSARRSATKTEAPAAGKPKTSPRAPRSGARPAAISGSISAGRSKATEQPKPAKPTTKPAASSGPTFSNLIFSSQVTRDGRPIGAGALLPSGRKELFATFDFDGMRNGRVWKQVWAVDGKIAVSEDGKWSDGPRGRKVLRLANPSGLPDGQYHLVLTLGTQVVAEGEVVIGRRVDDTDTEVSGQVVDGATGRGIADALVIALKPGITARAFVQSQDQKMAYTYARTDRNGRFTFPQQLPKGQAYGLVVVARGYRDMAIESALRIGAGAPEQAQLNPIPMTRD